MTGLVRFPSFLRTPAAAGRLRLALAVSALAHWALLATPPADTRRPGAAPPAIGAPMTLRFAPRPDSLPQARAVTDAEGSHMPERPGPVGGTSGHAPSHMPATTIAPPGADAPAVLRAPDPTYYPARELDAYPQPARPLALDRPAGAGSIRLQLLIDEHGVVNDVSLVEADAVGLLEETLRAALVAARFVPARKDGRDVKSRVLLSVGPGPGSGDR
jgi:protein TonB